MTKLHFWCNGDSDTGIQGQQVEFELFLEGYTQEETRERIEHAKQVLSAALSEIWDDRVHAATAEEFER